VKLALLSSFGIVVVIFYLENRTRNNVTPVRVECFKFSYNLMHLLPAEGVCRESTLGQDLAAES